MSSNAIVATTEPNDLVGACALVTEIAEFGDYPTGVPVVVVREAIGRVATRLGDSFAWKAKLATARNILAQEIDRVAIENANRRKAEAAARAEETQKRLKEAAERAQADREARHNRNLRHQQNKLARAERNRTEAKGFGAGTKQGGSKGKKH